MHVRESNSFIDRAGVINSNLIKAICVVAKNHKKKTIATRWPLYFSNK